MLPTCTRATARRTYSLRMAQFWDAYFIAISCNICASAKYWLTMPKLALPSRGIVPNWDQYHLPAEASRCTQFACTFCRSPSANSPGQPSHMAGTILGPLRSIKPNTRFKLVVGLHHPTEPHRGNSCHWAGLLHNAQIVHRTTIVVTIIIVPGPHLWYQRDRGSCGLSHLDRPTHVNCQPKSSRSKLIQD